MRVHSWVSLILLGLLLVAALPLNNLIPLPFVFGSSPELSQSHMFSVDSTKHDMYGLTYPITYEFSIPDGSSDLEAYKRFGLSENWVQIVEKTSDDLFNGVEAVRFDYDQSRVYVSVAFAAYSEFVYLCFRDSGGTGVVSSFFGVTDYYDNREVAVSFTIDDVGIVAPWGGNENFTKASIAFADAKVWWTAGWTTGYSPSVELIEEGILQEGLNRGCLEIASHSRTHPPPYSDYDSEIGGSKDDIITNLDLPYKKGSEEYVWCWIEPAGYSDDMVQQKLGEYKYLVSRNINRTHGPTYYEQWNSEYGLYERALTTIYMDERSLAEINEAFDAVYSVGGIYHPWGHVGKLGWESGMKGYEHIQYVKEKNDVWYVGFGHLYAYLYASQSVTRAADGGMRFGVNYFSTHNHYEPYYLSDEELHRDFGLFQDQGLKYVTLCAIWKYLEPELGNYNEAAIDDLVRVCNFASQYDLKVVINFYTMMSSDSWTMPEWLSPRKFEAVFLNQTARQAWLDFLNHTAASLNSSESIWSWNMMNEPWRREWACDVSIDDFIQLWTEMKVVFKAYSDRHVSVRFAAQAFEDPNHFNSDPRIYTLLDYLALNYYEIYCPSENLTRIVSDAQQNGCSVVISEFGSNATADADQASDYQRILELFRSLGLTDCIAWMWRADYDLGGPDLPGVGWNLAKDVDGTPRAAFLLLANEYELAIAVEGSGSTVPGVGSYMYEYGNEVNVTAIPNAAWMFDHWTLDGVDAGSADHCTVTMNSPHYLTAVFVEIPPKKFNLDGVTAWYWTDNTTINAVGEEDVDSDGSPEIVTAGYYFDGLRECAQLAVWDGSTLSVDGVTAWYWSDDTRINSVAVGNLDEDDALEIVTAGFYFDGTRKVAQLIVWDGATLAVEDLATWYWTSDTEIKSVKVEDVDGDGSAEIVTGGYHNDGTRDVAQLVVWDGETLTPLRYTSWYWTGETRINDLSVANVDGDAEKEIVTGGYYTDARKTAQLVVWDGLALSPQNIVCWYWTSDTEINSVVTANVDGDEDVKFVTGGYYNDLSRDVAQLVVWSSDLTTVENLVAWYWTSDTTIESICVGDVDFDGSAEIVTGGSYNDLSRDAAQLVVWDGTNLAVDYLTAWYWTDNTCICSVAVGNVDADISTEIITGGYFHDSLRDCAQATVWEIS